jgi:hypothetical protein
LILDYSSQSCRVLGDQNQGDFLQITTKDQSAIKYALVHFPRARSMSRAEAKTAVLPDGLRYKSKVSGSPFAAAASFGGATMSCFMCGKHRARSLMGTRKVLGKAQAVCAPSCKELDAQLAKN